MKAGQHVWLVKYALTAGITEEVVRSANDKYAYIVGRSWGSFKLGQDLFETYSAAVTAAEAMRQKKLESLRKQCMKLEKLKF